MKSPVLKIEGVSVQRDRALLSDVSLEVEAEQILLVLGPSGSGKSTLLRSINRLQDGSAGRVLLNGEDTAALDVKELRRKVGMVFQSPALVADTVTFNLALGPSLRGEILSNDAQLALLREVGLAPEFLERQVETLSLGEQQRVAFAQVLANRPEILLLDEPTSALDPTAVLTIENLIRKVHRDLKTATVLVTHNVEQALRFDTETLVLMEGRIIARGNIQDLMNDKHNETLARFFEGRLSEGDSHAG